MKTKPYIVVWLFSAILLVSGKQESPSPPLYYPPVFPVEVGVFATYRVSKHSQREFRGISQETESRELTIRAAITGKEIRKERRRRKKMQTYYWVEFDVGDGASPRVWQKLMLLVHEDDLKVGRVLNAAREYVFQKGEDMPIYTTIDVTRDRRLLEPFRMFNPDMPLKVEIVGTEAYRAGENAPPAHLLRFSGETVLKPDVTDIKMVHRRVSGRAKTAADVPFNILRLEYTEETTEIHEKSPFPSRTIVSITLALLDSGNDAKRWVTSIPQEMRTREK